MKNLETVCELYILGRTGVLCILVAARRLICHTSRCRSRTPGWRSAARQAKKSALKLRRRERLAAGAPGPKSLCFAYSALLHIATLTATQGVLRPFMRSSNASLRAQNAVRRVQQDHVPLRSRSCAPPTRSRRGTFGAQPDGRQHDAVGP
ncbi:hypothetical protein PLICRDRAFT_315722 [Plicaturopsis crispa FD-325 SS-3]|nr:hypothetical protein PLICRDRAFT_315722 [Plicaturopsis crispa FD-325 SS-3]